MLYTRIRRAMTYYCPRHEEMLESIDTRIALLALSLKHRTLLVMRALGYTERESMQAAGSRSRQDFKRAQEAFEQAPDHSYLLRRELGLAA